MRRARFGQIALRCAVVLSVVGAGLWIPQQEQPIARAADAWPFSALADCVTASDEFCIDTLGFTAEGSSTEVVYADAVPALVTGSAATHPNTYVQVTPATGGMIYGKALNSLVFEFGSPTSTKLGSFTETGIPAGTYRLVIRTGKYRPHSMTIKGRPVDATPFKATKESDGTYLWELKANAEALVMSMDLTTCRKDESLCEASNAFVKTLKGFMYLVPPDYVETPSPVSPSLDVSQGLWLASNSTLWDVKPEMNLVTKSLSLPAYGPHYVPTDFPTAGLVEENGRYLNPAYFEVFVPTALAAFMANFTFTEVKEKLPGKVKATIEKLGKEVPAIHTLDIKTEGGLVKVKLDHYSAPNPRVYVGAESTTDTTTTSTTTSTAPATTTPVASGTTSITLKKRGSMTLSTLAKKSDLSTSGVKTITARVMTVSRGRCRVSGGRLIGVAAGSCKVQLTLTSSTKKKSVRTVTVTIK